MTSNLLKDSVPGVIVLLQETTMVTHYFETLHRVSTLGPDFACRTKGILPFKLDYDDKTFFDVRPYLDDTVEDDITPLILSVTEEIKAEVESYSVFCVGNNVRLVAKKTTVGTSWFKEVSALTLAKKICVSLTEMSNLNFFSVMTKHENAFFSSINEDDHPFAMSGLVDLEQRAILCIKDCGQLTAHYMGASIHPFNAIATMCNISLEKIIIIEKALKQEIGLMALKYSQNILERTVL